MLGRRFLSYDGSTAAFLVAGLLGRCLLWFVTLALCLILTAMLATSVWIGVCASGADEPAADYLVVLGAGVNGSVPSLSLRERLDAALAYLQEYPESKAVLSGGKGSGEDLTEAQCMFDWLTARGIAPERLLREEASTSTQENLRFSLDVIEAQTGQRPAEIALISSEYHLYRAEWFARQEGVTAYGVPAHTSNFGIVLNFSLREIAAVGYYCVLGG